MRITIDVEPSPTPINKIVADVEHLLPLVTALLASFRRPDVDAGVHLGPFETSADAMNGGVPASVFAPGVVARPGV
jgi:hypothetical protein